jgi:hypothetical protein
MNGDLHFWNEMVPDSGISGDRVKVFGTALVQSIQLLRIGVAVQLRCCGKLWESALESVELFISGRSAPW